jgi:hypothetical protein
MLQKFLSSGSSKGGRKPRAAHFCSSSATRALLRPQDPVPVDPPASKKAVIHHALGKQKYRYRQGHQKKELPNLKPAGLLSCGGSSI